MKIDTKSHRFIPRNFEYEIVRWMKRVEILRVAPFHSKKAAAFASEEYHFLCQLYHIEQRRGLNINADVYV